MAVNVENLKNCIDFDIQNKTSILSILAKNLLREAVWSRKNPCQIMRFTCCLNMGFNLTKPKLGLDLFAWRYTGKCYRFVLFVWFDPLPPINNLSVMQGRVFLDWTSTKLGLMCLAQGHNSDVSEARTHSPSVLSQTLYHWATSLQLRPWLIISPILLFTKTLPASTMF